MPTTLEQLGLTQDAPDSLTARLLEDAGQSHYVFDPSVAAAVLREAWSNQ